MAIGQVYLGSNGNTKKQIKKALHFQGNQDQQHQIFSEFYKNNNNNPNQDQGLQIKLANTVFIQKGLQILESYSNQLQQYYDSGMQVVDFIQDPKNATKIANEWVKEETQGIIKQLIQENQVDQNTRMILASAIYFKGFWQKPFENYKTKKAQFQLENGGKCEVDMMEQEEKFIVYEGKQLQALQMQYRGGQYSIVIILPKNKKITLDKFKQQILSPQEFKAINQHFKEQNQEELYEVYLPKFKIEYDFSGLPNILKGMGMIEAFQPGMADFSNMIDSNQKELFIGEIIHKAFIEVNEQGTEASAATAIRKDDECLRRPKLFKADRSFIFYIMENQSGNIMFQGNFSGEK